MAALTANKTRLVTDTHTRHTLVMNSNGGDNAFVGGVVFVSNQNEPMSDNGGGTRKAAGIAANAAVASLSEDVQIEFGHVERFTIGAGTPLVGEPVYATTSGDITLTALNASRLGTIVKVISSTIIDVHVTGDML